MRQRRWSVRLSLLFIVIALTVSASLMHALNISSLAAVQSFIDSYTPYLMGLRLLIIGLIASAWPRLIRYAQHSGRMSEERGTELESLHWRIVVWLLIIELLVGQNLVGRLSGGIGGAGA